MRFLFSCLLAFGFGLSLCQNAQIFKENFDSGIIHFKSDGDSCSLRRKGVRINFFNNTVNQQFVLSSAKVYHEQDFVIETTVSKSERSAVLVIGDIVGDDYMTFQLNSGPSKITHVKGGEAIALKSYDVIIAANETKIPFKLIKTGDKIDIFSADQFLSSVRIEKLRGSQVGFSLHGGLSFDLHQFEIGWSKKFVSEIDDAGDYGQKESLGASVNSEYNDLFPIINPEGNKLFFVRKEASENAGNHVNDDVWFSNINEDGSWGDAQHMGASINDQQHNSVSTALKGGKELFLLKQYSGEGKKIKDGYFLSKNTGGSFVKPTEQKIKGYQNEFPFISACMSQSKDVMILTLKTDRTFGYSDLYVSTKIKDNQWSEPINLGRTINTFGVELAPFLSPDGRTLYFASDGHGGYGGTDIFMSKRIGNSWTKWSQPKNMGEKVNSPFWDAYFSVSQKEDFAYVCSYDNSIGGVDIFRVPMPKKVVLTPTLILKGNVYDSLTMKPMEAALSLRDLYDDHLITSMKSDPTTGYYEVEIKRSEEYSLLGEKRYYNADKENIKPSDAKTNEIRQDLYLNKYGPGQKINLNRIYFVRSKPVILETSFGELKKLLEILTDNPHINIRIDGHTDNVGAEDANLKLSQERTEAIKEHLIEKGIDGSRLSAKGFGETTPIAPNNSEKHKKLNRRVEFLIVD